MVCIVATGLYCCHIFWSYFSFFNTSTNSFAASADF